MVDVRQRPTTVGHMVGATFRHMHLLDMVHIAHDTYDTHETQTQNSWSHFWGNFQTRACVIYDTYCTWYI